MGSKVGFVAGVVTGLAMGYLLGIFSAPQAGKDTLAEIGDRAMELRGKAEEVAGRVKEDVRGAISSATEMGEETR